MVFILPSCPKLSLGSDSLHGGNTPPVQTHFIVEETISERYLIPVLEALLEQFPFVILAFHADNGSEYINQHVVRLLNKLLIELTKSRSRHSNDNA